MDCCVIDPKLWQGATKARNFYPVLFNVINEKEKKKID